MDPHRVNIITPQVISHQLQGVKFVTPHIPLLRMKPLKKKQPSGREESEFSGEKAYGSEAQGGIHRKPGRSWNLLLNLNVCQFLFKENL